jgi:hypothetical protein
VLSAFASRVVESNSSSNEQVHAPPAALGGRTSPPQLMVDAVVVDAVVVDAVAVGAREAGAAGRLRVRVAPQPAARVRRRECRWP